MLTLSWKLMVALILTGLSLILCLLHIAIFRDAGTLFFYLALDVVFVPVQVLLVTIIIERLLSEREKQAMMRKLNMVIGAFFSEVGASLMRLMGHFCTDVPELAARFAIDGRWGNSEYKEARKFAQNYECRLAPQIEQVVALRGFLLAKRAFVLGLLQNPNLLEHEKFTDLLWAVCHLTEELEVRQHFEGLPPSDLAHLRGDMQRAYGMLTREWLSYMEHLKQSYPYIYSLEVRMNPFKLEPSPLVS